jgi:nitroreductase
MPSNKLAQTSESINDVIASRWSPRAFDADKAVTRERITALLEAARWAPSCFGDEPWRFLVFDKARDPESWHKARACLVEGNQVWADRAPILMASVADSRFRRNGKPNRWGMYDTGAAAISLCLQATAQGMIAHQMGGFDAEKLAVSFGIPDGFTPMAMIAIGYEGDPDRLPEGPKEAELADRLRQTLDKIAFSGHWDSPYSD